MTGSVMGLPATTVDRKVDEDLCRSTWNGPYPARCVCFGSFKDLWYVKSQFLKLTM